MSKIKYSDLFDFEGWFREMDKMEARSAEFSSSTVKVLDLTTEAFKRQTQAVKELSAALRAVNPRSSSGGSDANKIGAELEKTIATAKRYKDTLESIHSAQDVYERSIADLKQGLGALKKEYDNLDPTSKTFATDQQNVANKTRIVTEAIGAQSRAMKAAQKSVNEANGSYRALARDTNEMKERLRGLSGAFDTTTGKINKHNSEAVLLQKQVDKNMKVLKNMDASMGNYQRNVGNYAGSLGKLRVGMNGVSAAFSSAAPAVIGVATAYEAVSKSIGVVDQFSRLKLGMEAVSSSSRQVIERFDFLRGIADKTGQNIQKLSESYISFTAATRNTALQGKEGDKVFRAFSLSFAALGKSSEVAERGLYAVQQMMSKGKISSEELNQQLAEALPGANKIFADATHHSVAELSELMKKGKILSADVLPAVAEQLLKLYGAQAQKNIQTISGSWERVKNQLSLVVAAFDDKGSISKFFSSINNGIADSIKGFSRLYKQEGLINALFGGGTTVKDAAKDQNTVDDFKQLDTQKRLLKIQQERAKLGPMLEKLSNTPKRTSWGQNNADFILTETAVNRQKTLIKELIAANVDLRRSERADGNAPKADAPVVDDESKSKRKLTQFEKLSAEADKLSKVIADDFLGDAKAGRALDIPDKTLDKWNKIYDLIVKVSLAMGESVPSEMAKLNDKLNKNPTNIADQIPIIPMPDEEKQAQPKNPEIQDIGKFVTLLNVHEKEMQDLVDKLDSGSLRKFSDSYATQIKDQLAEIQALEKEASLAQTADEKDQAAQRIQTAKMEYDEKIRLAREEVAAKKELQAQLTELALVAADAIFQIGTDQRDADIAANQAQMEHELSLVQGNEEAQKRIKEEYGKKDLALRQKQAKMDKAQAAFSIGISTARAIANAIATGGPPWVGIALAAVVGAMGAIQLAAVLAKPLPQFYKGTDNAPEGPAHVAERGPEFVESKGRLRLHENPTITHLQKGDKVFTAAHTRLMRQSMRAEELNDIAQRSAISNRNVGEIQKTQMILMKPVVSPNFDYDKMADAVGKSMDGRPIHQHIYDEHGARVREINKNSRIEYFSKRYSLKK